jgi:hypothetical protein
MTLAEAGEALRDGANRGDVEVAEKPKARTAVDGRLQKLKGWAACMQLLVRSSRSGRGTRIGRGGDPH